MYSTSGAAELFRLERHPGAARLPGEDAPELEHIKYVKDAAGRGGGLPAEVHRLGAVGDRTNRAC